MRQRREKGEGEERTQRCSSSTGKWRLCSRRRFQSCNARRKEIYASFGLLYFFPHLQSSPSARREEGGSELAVPGPVPCPRCPGCPQSSPERWPRVRSPSQVRGRHRRVPAVPGSPPCCPGSVQLGNYGCWAGKGGVDPLIKVMRN